MWFEHLGFLDQIAVSVTGMKGMKSNVWSAETLLRGTRAVSQQPSGLLSLQQLNSDAALKNALNDSLSFINLSLPFST